MAIKLWGNTNITLTNTSFTVANGGYPAMVVSLFTASSAWNYHFEWDLLDSGVMSVSISINSTPKEIWSYYDGVTHHVTYEFTLAVWDIVTLEASWNWTGSNLTVTRYADEPKEIFVWEWTPVDDYSAMRWPCPEGFHVPSESEWSSLKGMFSTFWISVANANWMKTYLRMPFMWCRLATDASVWYRNSQAYYWTVSIYNGSRGYTVTSGSLAKGIGCPIRPFKDVPVIPDSTWTTLYDWSWTATGAGVFHNSTLWLISVSSDWTTWITIADKNLWATAVYNNDTMSQTNCGYYYQRWNNYWFNFDWSLTTSSTRIDTTDYWPWNYYSSSTFITYNWNWSSVTNNNLRWWTTWIQQKHIWNVTEVYVGTTKVRPE